MENSRPIKERRSYKRVIINKQVWLCDFEEETAQANRKDCLVVDISEGGACIQCSVRFAVGQPIAFTYRDFMEDGLRPVVGVVMWSKQCSETKYRYGVKFLGLNTSTLRKIQEQVDQATERNDQEPVAQLEHCKE